MRCKFIESYYDMEICIDLSRVPMVGEIIRIAGKAFIVERIETVVEGYEAFCKIDIKPK